MDWNSLPHRICFPFTGDTVGGSHISAGLFIQNLDRRNYLPLVVLHQEGPLADYFTQQSIPYMIFPIPKYVGRQTGIISPFSAIYQTAFTIQKFILDQQIDLVQTNDMRMHLTWALPTRLARRKFLWHQCSRWGTSRLLSFMLHFPHQIVTVSDSIKKDYHFFARNKIVTIIDPYDIDAMEEILRTTSVCIQEKLSIPDDTKIIGFFGNFTEQKRPLFFIDLCAALCKKQTFPLAFVLFGQEREIRKTEILQYAKQKKIDSQVFVPGFQSPVEPWMAACDLIAAPSLNEAYCRVLVEAQLAGTPVVAADSGGNAEIIQPRETGILVPPDNPEIYADALAQLLSNPTELQRIREKAKQQARQNYSITSHVHALSQLYDNLLSS